jgi:hypothetical protein
VLAGWIKAIGRTLEAAGCDSAALLAEAGFDRECMDSATARCPLANTARLWEISVAATGDPAFGVKVASHIKQTTFHALSYGLTASSTLKEAFERLKRYCHVGSYAVEYEFFKLDSAYHCVIETTARVPHESIDALVGAQLRMCRSLLGRDYSPLLIELQRPRPARVEDFERLLRTPLRFNTTHNRMVFDSAAMECQLECAGAGDSRCAGVSFGVWRSLVRYRRIERRRLAKTRRYGARLSLAFRRPAQVRLSGFDRAPDSAHRIDRRFVRLRLPVQSHRRRHRMAAASTVFRRQSGHKQSLKLPASGGEGIGSR